MKVEGGGLQPFLCWILLQRNVISEVTDNSQKGLLSSTGQLRQDERRITQESLIGTG